MSNYSELPVTGTIVISTGEVLEYRADSVRRKGNMTIVEGARFRDHEPLSGSYTLTIICNMTYWQRFKEWIRKIFNEV